MNNKQSSTKNHDLFSNPSLTGKAIHFAARMINYKLLNPALLRILRETTAPTCQQLLFSKSLQSVSLQNTYGARFSSEALACVFSAHYLQSWPDSRRDSSLLSLLWPVETACFNRTLPLFSPSSLPPIHVNYTGKHLESTSLLSPSLSHRREYLPSRNLGSSLPMSTSFAALLRAAVMEEAISCPAGRQWRALGCSRPPSCPPAAGRGWGRKNVKARESAGLQTCIWTQSSQRMHGYKNGIHYYSIN